jgi:hypothetical protein
MTESEFGGRSNRLPFRSAHFQWGVVFGLGVGLLLAAALVELGALASDRKAWVSLVGAVLAGVSSLMVRRGQPSSRVGGESGASSDRGMSSPRGS